MTNTQNDAGAAPRPHEASSGTGFRHSPPSTPQGASGGRAAPVHITIPGKPGSKARPRFSRKSGVAYTPAKTVQDERTIGVIAKEHFTHPIEGPVRLRITAVFQIPKSWPKKKKAALLWRPHTQKPDADNIAKIIKDALNRIAWADDAQVAEMQVRKVWGDTAHTTVSVEGVSHV